MSLLETVLLCAVALVAALALRSTLWQHRRVRQVGLPADPHRLPFFGNLLHSLWDGCARAHTHALARHSASVRALASRTRSLRVGTHVRGRTARARVSGQRHRTRRTAQLRAGAQVRLGPRRLLHGARGGDGRGSGRDEAAALGRVRKRRPLHDGAATPERAPRRRPHSHLERTPLAPGTADAAARPASLRVGRVWPG